MRIQVRFIASILFGIFLASSLATAQFDQEEAAQEDDSAPTTEEPTIYEVTFEAEEAGSGDGEPLPECKLSYIKFERYYLRGVKEPNYISFNGSSFADCEEKCCYEDRFECKSFSYFSTLQVCFIMNVTKQSSNKFQMIKAGPWTHVERVANREVTTHVPDSTTYVAVEETTAAAVEDTTAFSYYYEYGHEAAGSGSGPEGSGLNPVVDPNSPSVPEETTTSSVFNSPSWKGNKGYQKPTTTRSTSTEKTRPNPFGGNFQEPTRPEKLVDNGIRCNLLCHNDGSCQLRRTPNGETISHCKCVEGYEGRNCETEVSVGGGFPAWIIVIIVLGSIILILFLTVFIMYQIYRRKTGEYKVVKQIQKWTRRGKKPKKATGNPEDLVNPETGGQTSPTTSVQSIHGSVTSSTTHSTSTSV